jgi:hypothetical protein
MSKATQVLLEAEQSADEHYNMVVRDPTTGHQSKVYPPGSEYLLVQAHAQLLGAILGILKESWTESLTGLNKLRKGYASLAILHEAEKKYLAANPPAARPNESDDVNELETADKGIAAADDSKSVKSSRSVRGTANQSLAIAQGTSHIDFRTVTSDRIDLFVHAGMATVFGIVKIALSITPPALKQMLALFSFHGDRHEGLQLLWDGTDYKENIFGAIAALVTLMYNHIGVAVTDIIPEGAVPEARLQTMLQELRKLYPDSHLWLTMTAREAAIERDLERAVEILEVETASTFTALEGMRQLEQALNLMFLHRFEECAATFLKCTELNQWSHAIYFFNAAACHIELYRDLKATDAAQAQIHADKAEEILKPVPEIARKKFMMGRQLPFDEFIAVKIEKWQARSAVRGCHLVEAIGVSPLEEMTYFWTGYRRKQPHQLQASLDRLEKDEQRPEWTDETIDERAAQALLKAIVLRCLGKYDEAKTMIREQVLCHKATQIKACAHATEYPTAVGHYELAVCLWFEGGAQNAPLPVLREVRAEIEKASKERYQLEERMTSKLLAARATLTNLGA